MPIQASTMNHYLSTPNKLFECLAAGTPVVVSDFPAMRSIVVDDPDGPLGATCDPARVDQVAAALRSILDLPADAWTALSGRCVRAAQARWNWERESSALLDVYSML
jgi:glycosyltransferase involved in cell wall biosynthesis